MKETDVYVRVKVDVFCPECEHCFDLCEESDFFGGGDGYRKVHLAMENEKDRKIQSIVGCPECKTEFKLCNYLFV